MGDAKENNLDQARHSLCEGPPGALSARRRSDAGSASSGPTGRDGGSTYDQGLS
jgi:hypothetical protein